MLPALSPRQERKKRRTCSKGKIVDDISSDDGVEPCSSVLPPPETGPEPLDDDAVALAPSVGSCDEIAPDESYDEVMGDSAYLEDKHGLSVGKIVKRIAKLIKE